MRSVNSQWGVHFGFDTTFDISNKNEAAIDAKVTLFDAKARKMNVSIKALEIAEEKEAVAQYGSSDSGASLGDILGAALKKKDAEAKSD